MTAAYWLASQNLPADNTAVADSLRNLFITGALLTVVIGLILPGRAARAGGTMCRKQRYDWPAARSRSCRARFARWPRGILTPPTPPVDVAILSPRSNDELGRMAQCFNQMQAEIARIVIGLDGRQRRICGNDALRQSNSDRPCGGKSAS